MIFAFVVTWLGNYQLTPSSVRASLDFRRATQLDPLRSSTERSTLVSVTPDVCDVNGVSVAGAFESRPNNQLREPRSAGGGPAAAAAARDDTLRPGP
jgi:hypothetical protein